MRWLITIFCLLFATGLQAQSYTVTENNCRVYFSNALDREAFWVDQLLWRHVGSNPDQLQIFDGISAITIQDANLVNYPTTDSLIVQMEAWIVECDTAGQAPPVPPGPSALFANARSIEMDGLTETVLNTASNSNLQMSDGGSDIPFTVAMWIYPEPTTDGAHTLFAASDLTPNLSYQAQWFKGVGFEPQFSFYVYQDGTNFVGYSSNNINTINLSNQQWIHVTGVYDGAGAVTVYVNGFQDNAVDESNGSYTSIDAGNNAFTIGSIGGAASFFDGKIDQLCVFRNVALTLPEIKELTTIRDVTQHSKADSLVLYHEYDDPDTLGAGAIIDLSPDGLNDGTATSMTAANFTNCITWPYTYQLDTSASWANLTPMQSAADTSFGGFAWNLDGVNESIVIPDNNLLSFTDGAGTDQPFSISIWSAGTDYDNTALVNKSGEYTFNQVLSAGNQKILTTLQTSPGNSISVSYNITGLTRYESGKYSNYVMTYDGSELDTGVELYINGQPVSETRNTSGTYTGMSNTTARLFIGADTVAADYHPGNIADPVIYNYELTAAEVLNQYNDHKPQNLTTLSNADSIVGYWRAYNSSNVSAGILDQSGNGLNGFGNGTDITDFNYNYAREAFDGDYYGTGETDGTAEFFAFPDSDSITMLNAAGTADTSFSISFWVDPDDANSVGYLAKGTGAWYESEYDIAQAGSGALGFYLIDKSASAYRGVSTTDLTPFGESGYHHVVVTYNGTPLTGQKIYIDGIEMATTTAQGGTYTAMENTNNTLKTGYWRTLYYLDGRMNHLTIMKGITLTQCQVQEIYNNGSPVNPLFWTFWNDAYVHWKIDNESDATIAGGMLQYSGNGAFDGIGVNTDASNIQTTTYPTN